MLNVRVNGQSVETPSGSSIQTLLERLGLAGRQEGVAVALNDELVPRARWTETRVDEGDRLEIVQAVQGGMDEDLTRSAAIEAHKAAAGETDPGRASHPNSTHSTDQPAQTADPARSIEPDQPPHDAGSPTTPDPIDDATLRVGPITLSSRLILGTARYPSMAHLYDALEAAHPGMVTVALRRVSLEPQGGESLWTGLASRGYRVLPNTAGCYTARDAILTAQLGREALGIEIVKLEVIGDERTLYPDAVQLLEAARELIAQGFIVMPYCNDDPILCQRLEQLGCPCVMPLAAPIGSGLGIRNPHTLALIRESVSVPLLVDAGVGTASDVAVAMELGMDGVLLNTAIAGARDPVRMAHAVRHALEAGRLAYRAGRIPRKAYADASSPVEGLIETRIGRRYEASFPDVPGSGKKR